MTEKTAKWIFWGGTLSSLALFLALTADTQSQFAALTHADRLDAQVVAGKRAFERYNCNDCHTIIGFGGYYAPDLTRAYTRLGEDTIKRRLRAPEVAFAGSYRKMPQQHLSAQEVDDITTFLAWVSNIENHDWPPQHSEARWKRSTERLMAGAVLSPGAALVNQEDCLSCHALGDRGERKGARLEWIAARRERRLDRRLPRGPGEARARRRDAGLRPPLQGAAPDGGGVRRVAGLGRREVRDDAPHPEHRVPVLRRGAAAVRAAAPGRPVAGESTTSRPCRRAWSTCSRSRPPGPCTPTCWCCGCCSDSWARPSTWCPRRPAPRSPGRSWPSPSS